MHICSKKREGGKKGRRGHAGLESGKGGREREGKGERQGIRC